MILLALDGSLLFHRLSPRMADQSDDDLREVTERLRGMLDGASGKLRAFDALALAGFDRPSFYRTQLVGRALRLLGWDRVRLRFEGKLLYAYARGSRLQREVILEVSRGDDGRFVVKRREP